MQTQTPTLPLWWGGIAFAIIFMLVISLTGATLVLWVVRAIARTEPRWLHVPMAVTASTLLIPWLTLTAIPAAELLAGGRPRDGRVVDGSYYVQLKGHESAISPTLFHLLLRARLLGETSLPIVVAVNLPALAYGTIELVLRKRREAASA